MLVSAFRLALATACAACAASHASHDERAWDLVRAMSVDELLGQMNQINAGDIATRDVNGDTVWSTKAIQGFAREHIGSYLNFPGMARKGNQVVWSVVEWRARLAELQAIHANYSSIPILYGLDSAHGANYIQNAVLFPQNINTGATFNVDLALAYGSFVARDTKAAGVPWMYSPVLDVVRHKHWPRLYETFGEDPRAVSSLGAAMVRGIQSNNVAACFKHFIGYSNPQQGNDRENAEMSDFEVLNYFMPPFRAAIDEAGIMTGMGTFIALNDVPLSVNTKMHKGLLRHDLNFSGLLVSDWGEVNLLRDAYHVTDSTQGAVELTLNQASYDMSMVPDDTSFADAGKVLLAQQKVELSRIQQSVQRILKLKLDLGLFDIAVPGAELVDQVGDVASQEAALAVARESIVLLKNDNHVLPLDTATASVLFTGPSMDDIGLLCGGWTYFWQGTAGGQDLFPHGRTLRQALDAVLTGPRDYIQGVTIDGTGSIHEAMQLASKHTYTIVAVGERPYAEFRGNSDAPALPQGMLDYVHALATTGTKIILVLTEGRPRLLNGIADIASAILWAGLPCEMGGDAIADVLVGKVNPSGKLPFVYPKTDAFVNLATPYYFRKNDRCVKLGSHDACPAEWQYGAGLSYTTFVYSNIQLSSDGFTSASETLTISVTVTNTGNMTGKEVVMLFVTPPATRLNVETKLLKRFSKVELGPNDTTSVSFRLTADDWGYFTENIGHGLHKVVDAGVYTFFFKAETDCQSKSDALCLSFQYGDSATNHYLVNPATYKALAADGGDTIGLVKKSPKDASQLWTIDSTSHSVSTDNGRLCLDAFEPWNWGHVHLWPCDAANANQKWMYDTVTQQLRHMTHTGFCLDMGGPWLWQCLAPMHPDFKNQHLELLA
ncbi:Aste57867_14658 [Aphanomyces stellatus]|uniref:beta-glucosidase n=1 Tax=Aphanomyces stellatus TaxID=120398 RepID=A0A485L284_9STRA|nr:hypothetical protein As57867_014603 [Aphanomyces stellatus]VFT91477.1 Aste57867_14658 [Aphanomyces stellatus]